MSTMRPWFGFHLPNFTFPDVPPERLFEHVVKLACAAEAAGFDLVTVMDHLYQIRGIGPETEPMLEAYTTLGAIAARTSRVKLGTLVTGVTYRNPALLAKEVTTLDVISGGRAILGLGAAWNEDEHRGYGFAFPPIKERMDRLDEALAIAKLLFTQERPSFEGSHYRIEAALNSPQPITPGGPPILVGGGGEQRTLRIAAKYADMTHWFPMAFENLQRKIDVMRGYCDEIGRDFATIQLTMSAPFLVVADESAATAAMEQLPPERRAMLRALTPPQAAEALKTYTDMGFVGFTFGNTALRDEASIGVAGELIRLVA
jgi:F420-dependent oxidoreductase-like protein